MWVKEFRQCQQQCLDYAQQSSSSSSSSQQFLDSLSQCYSELYFWEASASSNLGLVSRPNAKKIFSRPRHFLSWGWGWPTWLLELVNPEVGREQAACRCRLLHSVFLRKKSLPAEMLPSGCRRHSDGVRKERLRKFWKLHCNFRHW